MEYTDLENIQRVQLQFYEKLYSAAEKSPDENEEALFLNAIHMKIPKENRENLDNS